MLLELYNKIGFAVCQQISDRTIYIDGLKMPVDARMTGLFIGFLITIPILLMLYSKATDYPQKRVFAFGILAILFLAFDGITSYTGLRQTTNSIRLVSGLPVGSFIAILLLSAFNETNRYFHGQSASKESKTKIKVLQSSWHQLLVLLALAFTFFLINSRLMFLKYLLPTFIISGIISAFLLLNLTVFNYYISKRSLRFTATIAASSLELFLAYQVHAFMLF